MAAAKVGRRMLQVQKNIQFIPMLDILAALFFAYILNSALATISDGFEEYLLCRQCGHDVVKADDLLTVPSRLAHRQRNDSIHGEKHVLIQLFKNPQGRYFEVITSTEADVLNVDQAYAADSWFPGYSWTVAVCPRCGHHLGWTFDKGDKTGQNHVDSFVGLILDNLLHQNYADNLLIVPKAYKS